jgi:hypothetical protein
MHWRRNSPCAGGISGSRSWRPQGEAPRCGGTGTEAAAAMRDTKPQPSVLPQGGRLNPPNRRIGIRTYGGVGGEEPRGSPLSRSTAAKLRKFMFPRGRRLGVWWREAERFRSRKSGAPYCRVTPGLDPGAQAATIVAGRASLALDARVKPAHDDAHPASRRVERAFDTGADDAVAGEIPRRDAVGSVLDRRSRRPAAPSTSWRPKLPQPERCQGRASRAAAGGLRRLTAFRLRKKTLP